MRILIAVAHADDETLGCFSVLAGRAEEVTVLHATDSAPLDVKYALRCGYETRDSYKAARREEVRTVLGKAGIPAARYHCLEMADQEAPLYWARIRAFAEAFGADRIYTHAYEGGHPDHDAMAFALHGLPGVWEFPLYHGMGADFVPHSFLDERAEETIELTAEQRERKREWLACFASQKRVIDLFPVERELFRPQATYDFTKPPHAGELYYERRQLGWTWPAWREATGKALH